MILDQRVHYTLAPLVLRLALAAIFIYHGNNKVFGPNSDLGASWATEAWARQNAIPHEFAERIRSHFPNAPAIIHEPLPEDDPKQRCPDISKAKKLLGWEPKVSLEEGLALTLEFFKGQYAKLAASL